MGPVHGHDVGQPSHLIGAAVIGGDAQAAGRVDEIGGMSGIGDLDLGGAGGLPERDRHGPRRGIGHRQAFAALWLLGEGRGEECAEQRQSRRNKSPHSRPRCVLGKSSAQRGASPMGCYHQRASATPSLRPQPNVPVAANRRRWGRLGPRATLSIESASACSGVGSCLPIFRWTRLQISPDIMRSTVGAASVLAWLRCFTST